MSCPPPPPPNPRYPLPALPYRSGAGGAGGEVGAGGGRGRGGGGGGRGVPRVGKLPAAGAAPELPAPLAGERRGWTFMDQASGVCPGAGAPGREGGVRGRGVRGALR